MFKTAFVLSFATILLIGKNNSVLAQDLFLVKDITPGQSSTNMSSFTELNGNLMFWAYDSAHGAELWISDATAAGTHIVKDINPGTANSVYYDSYLGFIFYLNTNVLNGIMYFSANDGVHGYELWRTDGTEAGTYMVKDIGVGATSGFSALGSQIITYNGLIYFSAIDTLNPYTQALWASDGATEWMVARMQTTSIYLGLQPHEFVVFKGKLFFVGYDSLSKSQIFYTGGSLNVLQRVATGYNTLGTYGPGFKVAGDNLFFGMDDGIHGRELWKIDGNSFSASLVKDIYPGSGWSIQYGVYYDNDESNIEYNNKLYFYADDGVHGDELWVSDGIANGTNLVNDINTGSGWSAPSQYRIFKDSLFFTAARSLNDYHFYKSDGTSESLTLIDSMAVSGAYYYPNDPTLAKDNFYYSRFTSLIKTDGTSAGTKQINGASVSQYRLTPLQNIGNYLFVQAYLPQTGTELFALNLCPDTATITPNNNINICQGQSVLLTASAGSSYLWSNGATASSISVSTAGNYTVTITQANGCVSTSLPATVNVNANPAKPIISASGSTTNVCPGKTVTLTSSAATAYLWSNGATTQSIVVNAAGNYTVTVSNSNGCTNISDPTIVTYQGCIKPTNPLVSNITSTTAKLSWAGAPSCAIGYQLQYRKTGTSAWTSFILTSTNKNVTGLTPNTTYQWKVQTGCQQTPLIASGFINGANFTTAASFAIAEDNSKLTANTNTSLYPNPVKDNLTVETASKAATKAVFIIVSAEGKTVQQITAQLQSGNNKITIPVAELASGTYLLRINTNNGQQVMKFVKE